jgi:hypothetical protein
VPELHASACITIDPLSSQQTRHTEVVIAAKIHSFWDLSTSFKRRGSDLLAVPRNRTSVNRGFCILLAVVNNVKRSSSSYAHLNTLP